MLGRMKRSTLGCAMLWAGLLAGAAQAQAQGAAQAQAQELGRVQITCSALPRFAG